MPETTTRERMIATAMRLFRRDGYAATSWRRLVEEAGTPWGSAYHHFPGGKEELGVAAVRLGTELVAATVRGAFERNDTTADAVHWWYRKAGEALAGDDYRGGCPLATITLEMAHASATLTEACARAFADWHRLLVELLVARGHTPARADDLALAIVHNLEGALLLSRIRRSVEPLTAAAGHVATLLAPRAG